MNPAVAILEFDSIARGIEAGDAMVKRAPLEVIRAGTVHPGKYLVLVGGRTADVEEALEAGRAAGSGSVLDEVYLPDVHPDVVASIGGVRRPASGEALGIVETRTVAAVIDAADGGMKGARVVLRELRLADELGGKGYALFGGDVAEVEAAVEHGLARIAGSGLEVAHVVIAQLHDEMDGELSADPGFLARIAGAEKSPDDARPVTPGVRPGRPKPGTGGSSGDTGGTPAPPPKARPSRARTPSHGATPPSRPNRRPRGKKGG